MSTARFPLPLIEVWATPTRRSIIAYLVQAAHDDEAADRERQWHTLHDMMDETGTSRESLRTELSAGNQMLLLHETGLVTVRNADANIRHYRLAATPPAQLLVDNHTIIPVLNDLLQHTASQKLVTFFLDDADPEESYSEYALHQATGIGYTTLQKHLPTLVAHNLVTAVEGNRTTEYTLQDGALAAFCWDLNDALATEFES